MAAGCGAAVLCPATAADTRFMCTCHAMHPAQTLTAACFMLECVTSRDLFDAVPTDTHLSFNSSDITMMQDQTELTAGQSAGRQPSLVPFRRASIPPGQAQQLLNGSQQQKQGAAEELSGVTEVPPAMSSVEAAVEPALEEADGTALEDQVGHISACQHTMPRRRKSP